MLGQRFAQLSQARLGLALALVLSAAATARAATSTATFSVSVEVVNTCTLSTNSLGAPNPMMAHATTPLDITGKVHVKCTQGASGMLGLSQGNNLAPGSTAAHPLPRLTKTVSRRVAAGQNTPAGTYIDTITVTVEF